MGYPSPEPLLKTKQSLLRRDPRVRVVRNPQALGEALMPECTRTKPSLSFEDKTKPVESSHVPPDNGNQEQRQPIQGSLKQVR